MDTKIKVTIGVLAVAGAFLCGVYLYMHSSKGVPDAGQAYQPGRAEAYNAPVSSFRLSDFRKSNAISPPTMMPISSTAGKAAFTQETVPAAYNEPATERSPSYLEQEPVQTQEEDLVSSAASQNVPSSQQPASQQPSIIMGIPIIVSGGDVASGNTSTGTGVSTSSGSSNSSSGGGTDQPPSTDNEDDIADFVPQTSAGGPVDENAGAKSMLPPFTPVQSSDGPVQAEDDMM